MRGVEIPLRTGRCQTWTAGSAFTKATQPVAGDLGVSVCQDICSRFTFHLQSSWPGSQPGSGVSWGLQGSQGHRGCEDLSFALPLALACSCQDPHGYFSASVTCASVGEIQFS